MSTESFVLCKLLNESAEIALSFASALLFLMTVLAVRSVKEPPNLHLSVQRSWARANREIARAHVLTSDASSCGLSPFASVNEVMAD
jgi:hypothetical protein